MNVVLEGGLEISCFLTLSQDFFAGIPVFTCTGFLRIPPDSCSRQKLSD